MNLLGAALGNPFYLKGSVKVVCRSISMKALVVEEFGDSSKLKDPEVFRDDKTRPRGRRGIKLI